MLILFLLMVLKIINLRKISYIKLFRLYRENPEREVFILMDDVKRSTMANIWKSINYPKCILDMVGHWSGSGLFYLSHKI